MLSCRSRLFLKCQSSVKSRTFKIVTLDVSCLGKKSSTHILVTAYKIETPISDKLSPGHHVAHGEGVGGDFWADRLLFRGEGLKPVVYK